MVPVNIGVFLSVNCSHPFQLQHLLELGWACLQTWCEVKWWKKEKSCVVSCATQQLKHGLRFAPRTQRSNLTSSPEDCVCAGPFMRSHSHLHFELQIANNANSYIWGKCESNSSRVSSRKSTKKPNTALFFQRYLTFWADLWRKPPVLNREGQKSDDALPEIKLATRLSDCKRLNNQKTITIIFDWFGINVAVQTFLIRNCNQPRTDLLKAFIRLAVADWQRRQWLQLMSFLQLRRCNEKKQKQRSAEEVEEISLFVLGLRTLQRSNP